MSTRPFHMAGSPCASDEILEVRDKHTHEVLGRCAIAQRDHVDRSIGAATDAAEPLRTMPAYERRAVLEHLRDGIRARRASFAKTLAREAGKTIDHAAGEVDRTLDTLTLAAEEAVRGRGEWMDLEISERAAGYECIWKRVPIGPCSFILPFNFPMNLLAHKIGPAIARGCPFVAKPDPRTPLTSLMIGDLLAETDLPAGAFSILPVLDEGLDLFTEDPRIRMLSFTGSGRVGWALKARAGRKRVHLELGGIAPCIVEPDADLDDAADRITFGAFALAGQSCISVQRVLVQEDIYDEMRARLVERAERLPGGDPMAPGTFRSPLIDEASADRVARWVSDAVERGGALLTGGGRDGAMVEPTLLENVPADARLLREEAFGPVAVLQPYASFDDAIRMANETEYGLQCGVFTNDLRKAMCAFDGIEVGGVVINDIPSMRVDSMPYGGVKASGLGREGVRFAMDEMTEIRMLVMRRSAPVS